MWFHKKLLAGKFSHSSNLSIQQSLQNAVFLPSANMRVGDIRVSDGIVCRGIIFGYGCMHITFVLLSPSAEGWMAPEVKDVWSSKKLKAE